MAVSASLNSILVEETRAEKGRRWRVLYLKTLLFFIS
jgi:hypothetical protein